MQKPCKGTILSFDYIKYFRSDLKSEVRHGPSTPDHTIAYVSRISAVRHTLVFLFVPLTICSQPTTTRRKGLRPGPPLLQRLSHPNPLCPQSSLFPSVSILSCQRQFTGHKTYSQQAYNLMLLQTHSLIHLSKNIYHLHFWRTVLVSWEITISSIERKQQKNSAYFLKGRQKIKRKK